MLDNTGKLISDAEISRSDAIELYRKRREDAAALWATIPDEKFCIASWKCGTTCCAIGWLAEKQHDGWHFDTPYSNLPRIGINNSNDYDWGAKAINRYFGLTTKDTANCFVAANSYNPKTLAEVSEKLLSMPYEVYLD